MKHYKTRSLLSESFNAIHEQEKKLLKESKKSLKESFDNWTDAYNLFTACADRFFPDEEKIAQAAQQVYEIFKGDPQVEEAWKRWNDTDSVKDYEETDESLNENAEFKETLENGRTDTIEAQVLDRVFAFLRQQYSDEEFADLAINEFGMTPEELESFCGISIDESLTEDTVKQGNKWVNKGKEGTHGEFKTKKEADKQRAAMFARGYKG